MLPNDRSRPVCEAVARARALPLGVVEEGVQRLTLGVDEDRTGRSLARVDERRRNAKRSDDIPHLADALTVDVARCGVAREPVQRPVAHLQHWAGLGVLDRAELGRIEVADVGLAFDDHCRPVGQTIAGTGALTIGVVEEGVEREPLLVDEDRAERCLCHVDQGVRIGRRLRHGGAAFGGGRGGLGRRCDSCRLCRIGRIGPVRRVECGIRRPGGGDPYGEHADRRDRRRGAAACLAG